jgi:hypothetical protein
MKILKPLALIVLFLCSCGPEFEFDRIGDDARQPSLCALLAVDRAYAALEEFDGRTLADHELEGLKPPNPSRGWGKGGYCTEGWAYSVSPWFDDFTYVVNTAQTAEIFELYEEIYSGEISLIDVAAPGDWLSLDTNGDGVRNHAGMFLEYDVFTKLIKTLEFNTGNSQVLIKYRPLSQLIDLGHLIEAMESAPCD